MRENVFHTKSSDLPHGFVNNAYLVLKNSFFYHLKQISLIFFLEVNIIYQVLSILLIYIIYIFVKPLWESFIYILYIT